MTRPKTQKELASKYFPEFEHHYNKNNSGVVSLLSDIQHMIESGTQKDYAIAILNDIKSVLINEGKDELIELVEGLGRIEEAVDEFLRKDS